MAKNLKSLNLSKRGLKTQKKISKKRKDKAKKAAKSQTLRVKLEERQSKQPIMALDSERDDGKTI